MLVDLPNEKERERMSQSFCPCLVTDTDICPEILRLHLRDEKLNEDVNLWNIARKTPYFSGSDLKS